MSCPLICFSEYLLICYCLWCLPVCLTVVYVCLSIPASALLSVCPFVCLSLSIFSRFCCLSVCSCMSLGCLYALDSVSVPSSQLSLSVSMPVCLSVCLLIIHVIIIITIITSYQCIWSRTGQKYWGDSPKLYKKCCGCPVPCIGLVEVGRQVNGLTSPPKDRG